MYLNILKKDIRRKKTMNVILLLFMVLAVMFVSSGLNNVFTVMSGTDYYLDKAGVGDYILITMGENGTGNIAPVLDRAECVKEYGIESCIFGSQESVKHTDGTDVKTKNASLFQSVSDVKLKFFDEKNESVTEVAEGDVLIAGNFIRKNGFDTGDYIRIKLGDTEQSFRIAGKVKDAFLGSDFMGNTRFLMNQKDYDEFFSDEKVKANSLGEIAYIKTDDTAVMRKVSADIPGLAFDDSRSTVKMCYVMDMIIAFVVLILSVCLMIVSFIVLRFSIGFTISEEFREIGVMKAIGLKNVKIRGLYIVKYLLLSAVGGIAGFFAGIPFGKALIRSVSENMVLGNNAGLMINAVSTIGTAAVILLFAYSCTGKIKKLTPIDAIRSGQTGERFTRKSVLRLGKTNACPAVFMAFNDILSAPGRFMTVIVSFFICTLFVLMLVNTTETMKSSRLISLFGTESDLYVSDVDNAMKLMRSSDENAVENELKRIQDLITEEGMPCSAGVDIQYKYKITSEKKEYSFTCAQSKNIGADEYVYSEGTAPQGRYEIAVTPQAAEILEAEIGDTVTVDFGSEKAECLITAYFESMNNFGELIRFSDEAPTDKAYISGIMSYQISFTDNPSEDEINQRREEVKDILNISDVMNKTEYCIENLAVVPTMEAVQYLLLGITFIVVILVTVLVERSFISDEHSQIAILKAIGFRSGTIIGWHIARFGTAAFAAAVLAGAVSIPVTKLCITPVFGMMGAGDISFNINPFKIFLVYPLIIFAVTAVSAWMTSLYTKTIKASEATNIE